MIEKTLNYGIMINTQSGKKSCGLNMTMIDWIDMLAFVVKAPAQTLNNWWKLFKIVTIC